MPSLSESDQAAKRSKFASVVLTVPRRIHSHVSRRTASELYGFAKTAVVLITVIMPAFLGFVIVLQSLLRTPVVVTPINVPESYVKNAYSSEAATQRLLDEIANLNSISLAAKPKTDVGDTNFLGDVAATQIQSGLVDLNSIHALIRRFFGKDIVELSGEITLRKQGEEEVARLRLRRTPGRETLIDVESTEGPDALFTKGAMNLLERIDPEIAAGVYWREYGDIEAAKRLLSIALASPNLSAKKYAYNLKSYILSATGHIDEALAASDRARSLGDDTFAVDDSRAFALLRAKKFDEALTLQLRNVERYPNEQSTHKVLGMIYQATGRNLEAVACFRRSLELFPRDSGAYRRLAVSLRATGDEEGATGVLVAGMEQVPNSPGLLFDYAEDLRRRGKTHSAAHILERAAVINPDRWPIIASLAEVEYELGHSTEEAHLKAVMQRRLANGDNPPARLRSRVDAILKQSSEGQ
jgi:tetratricopeptide (TPR) repeat protein